jgi:hypothetical protein
VLNTPRVAIPGKVLIAGLTRDAAAYLPGVLSNIEKIGAQFDEAAFALFENDSKDGSKDLLRAWCAERPQARLFEIDGLAEALPIRTVRLAFLRNAIVDLMRDEFSDFDYLYLADCDIAAHWPVDVSALQRAVRFLADDPTRAAIFPNNDGLYIDLWALRAPWCPDDTWEATLEYMLRVGSSDEDAFKAVFVPRAQQYVPRGSAPRQVDSAFGGAGLYKIESVLKNPRRYSGHKAKILPTREGPHEFGWQTCEHVSFNLGFGAIGQSLYIMPDWINQSTPVQNFPPSGFRFLVFELKNLGQAPDFKAQFRR